MKKELSSSIEQTINTFNEKLASIASLKELESITPQFLGKKGSVTALFQNIKTLSLEEKKIFVPQLNKLKVTIEEAISSKKIALIQSIEKAAELDEQSFDVTAYKPFDGHKGHVHLYTELIEEIENIFISMGYDVWDGPYAETEYYNFTALNIPEDHPARDMYDTLWLNKKGWLLRTHTSTVQIRTMEKQQPPLAGIVPGTVFRHEAVDASHDIQFMQCEGLFVDKNITIAHLFGVAKTFLQKLFNKKELDIRIRPGYFPFVEPGVEIDMRCPFCTTGCSTCKQSCWIEVFPGGMVHPEELRMAGIDPEIYSGFAFGFGLTRLAMIKYGIPDIRLLQSGKISFLKQF
ncbi:phenylalanine--tRNA ligase subunit alpha [Candidatus Babeliales bacterium]|nr:phenylalanine--tRNA ligase subunit alpha [Candidatus Babeliales bacterium]